jgi:hypothetical protein
LSGWEANANQKGVPLVTVPAVQGRLVRFDGRAMHAVPKPSTRWLLSEEAQQRLKQEEIQALEEDDDWDGDDDWDDDYDDDEEEEDSDRSVILFNTWPNGPPPRGVDADSMTGALPLGIELDEEEIEGEPNEYIESDNVLDTGLQCNDLKEWREISILQPATYNDDLGDTMSQMARISLMGNQARRKHPKSIVSLHAPTESLRLALEDPSDVTLLQLRDPSSPQIE